jgi:membrane-associated PAP2 superfamily phosphatase
MEISKLHCRSQTPVSAWRVWIGSTEKWRHSTSMCCSASLPSDSSVQCAPGAVSCRGSQALVAWIILSSETVTLVIRNTAVTCCFVLYEGMICVSSKL